VRLRSTDLASHPVIKIAGFALPTKPKSRATRPGSIKAKPPSNGVKKARLGTSNGKADAIKPLKLNGSTSGNGHVVGAKRGPGISARSQASADRQLIDRAVAGETAAWEELYQQCHRPLMTAIRSMLRNKAVDVNLVDELAARVWYAVVRDQGELLKRFDPARGCRLTTYLTTLAKDEASRLFRSERRRRRREAASCDNPALTDATASKAGHTSVTIAEFEATLTPSEKKFYDEIVAKPNSANLQPSPASSNGNGANGNGTAVSRSQANHWQLSHRVRRKLERFLDG
jgi:DNA-directed RNA polymerase specialized sigma24 family protein